MCKKVLSKLPIIRKKSAKLQNPQTCVENFQNPQIYGEICESGNTGKRSAAQRQKKNFYHTSFTKIGKANFRFRLSTPTQPLLSVAPT